MTDDGLSEQAQRYNREYFHGYESRELRRIADLPEAPMTDPARPLPAPIRAAVAAALVGLLLFALATFTVRRPMRPAPAPTPTEEDRR